MLQQVVLQTADPMTLNIAAARTDDILIIKSISGLSPADVTLFTGEYARDGGYYQGRRVGKRNPVFLLKINPDYRNNIEVSDIREMIYKQFLEPSPDLDGVKMVFQDDRRPDRYLVGYTEKIETDMFTKEQTAQISMICVDPFFKSVDAVIGSDAAGWTSLPLTYEGSAATGFTVTMRVNGTVDRVTLDLNGKTMVLEGSFVDGDLVYISTVNGSRKITVNDVDSMALMTPQSEWLYLDRTDNVMKAYSETESDGGAEIIEYEYRASWWGI